MVKQSSFVLAAVMSFTMGGAVASFAETVVQAPQAGLPSPVASRAFPSVFGVPTAVAPRGGSSFVGATFVNPRGGISGDGADGDIVAGHTVGNPLDFVSLTFGLAITGIEPFADAGSLSLSVNRLLQASGTSATFVGASVSNVLPWGPAKRRDETYAVYVSHLAGIGVGAAEIPVQVTVGYGSDNTLSTNGLGALSDGVFGGVGFGLTERISAGFSFTETQVNLGSTISLGNSGLSATLGVLDVTDNANRRQVSLSASFSF